MKRTFLALASIIALSLTAMATDENQADADNTAKNQRDRSGETRTSGDQSNSREDLKTTQAIRKALMKDNSLSTTAKNIKIVTAGGQVTLRGPVKSADEKSRIDQLAKGAAGNAKIDNQLEIKAGN
jgi:hyperosmotically inducible periplasmic protein